MLNKLAIFVCTLAVIASLTEAQKVVKAIEDDWFPVTILHLNDMHAR